MALARADAEVAVAIANAMTVVLNILMWVSLSWGDGMRSPCDT
jgi:hypothetical protein